MEVVGAATCRVTSESMSSDWSAAVLSIGRGRLAELNR